MSQPTGVSHATLTMGALCAIGGVAGFAKASSKPSLIAGVALSAAFFGASHLINAGDPKLGFGVATGASAVLAAAMGARYVKTKAIFPAAVMAALGVASSIYHFAKYREWSQ